MPKATERENNMEMCGSCGAEMTMAPDAVVNDCAACGARLLGQQTPAVEDLNNVCRVCQHPIRPEHDDFGCHIPECTCTVTGADALAQIAALLSSRENRNSFRIECQKCKKRFSSDQAGTDKDGEKSCPKCGASNASLLYLENTTGKWAVYLDSLKTEDEAKEVGQALVDEGKASSWRVKPNGARWAVEYMTVAGELGNAPDHFRAAMEAFEAHVKVCAACGQEYSNPEPDPAKLCAQGRKLITAGNLENAGAEAYGKALDALSKKPFCAACKEPIQGTPKVIDGKEYHRQGTCAPAEKTNAGCPASEQGSPCRFEYSKGKKSCVYCGQAENENADDKCVCGQPKRDETDPEYHTPNSDRCKQIHGQRENATPRVPKTWKEYSEEVYKLEKEGLTTSDAQAVVDAILEKAGVTLTNAVNVGDYKGWKIQQTGPSQFWATKGGSDATAENANAAPDLASARERAGAAAYGSARA